MTAQNNIQSISEKQKEIILLPKNSKALVVAGPGTGKTHTLIHKLINLVHVQGLSPASELLVLSFSRAAIAEIRYRISLLVKNGIQDDFRFLNVRTFDSFATRLLMASDEDIDLSTLNYDSRIALAVRKLSDAGSLPSEILSQFEHVLVDEIQDLVGIRAQLVQKILERTSGGFTVFGDPAQGIFDYLVSQNGIGPTSIEFFIWLRENWQSELAEYSLDQNFRVTSPAAEVASQVRKLILSKEPDENAYRVLRNIIDTLPSIGSIENPNKIDISKNKSLALLCRTNSEVLFASNSLRKSGLPCVSPPHVEEKRLPPWIARVFETIEEYQVSFQGFENTWNKKIGKDFPQTASSSWNALKGIEGSDRANLNISKLRQKLRKGIDWGFDSETASSKNNIIVTTIHQSKGREYTDVFVLPSNKHEPNGGTSEDNNDEAKVLYVAATRAKESIYRIDRNGIPIAQNEKFPSGRERIIGQNRKGEHLFQVYTDDIDSTSYVSLTLFPTNDMAATVQELIWRKFYPGTSLSFVAQKLDSGFRIYLAWKNPDSGKFLPVAIMNDDFLQDLIFYKKQLPNFHQLSIKSYMEDCFVVERQTIILPAYPEDLHEPWATTGLCLGVSIKGMIVVD